MLQGETQVRVCYGDTDAMGVVYYGTYARYYEIGRNELIRSYGIAYKELEELGYGLIVASMECKYLLSAKYDDVLTLKTSVSKLPMVRLSVYTEIFNQHDELINIGKVDLAFCDLQTKKLCKAPDTLLEKIQAKF